MKNIEERLLSNGKKHGGFYVFVRAEGDGFSHDRGRDKPAFATLGELIADREDSDRRYAAKRVSEAREELDRAMALQREDEET